MTSAPLEGELATNWLLMLLANTERRVIESNLEHRQLKLRETVFEPGENFQYVYFPLGPTVVSLVITLRDGRCIEAATIGREGAVGGIISGGSAPTFCRATVQIPGPVAIAPSLFIQEVRAGFPLLNDTLTRYADCLFAQVAQSVACNAVHSIEARLSRWLLATQDRVGEILLPLTHEAIAEMLGIQRSSVTPVARELQRRGFIAYRHGRVRVLNRAGLEALSCECYGVVRHHFDCVLRIGDKARSAALAGDGDPSLLRRSLGDGGAVPAH